MKIHTLVIVLITIGIFTIASSARAATLVVTSLADDGGAGELREQMTAANASPGSAITFQSGLTGTITLTSDLPQITSSVTIQGPGASSLAIDGAGLYVPFYVNVSTDPVTISGLTLQNGYSIYNGGAILNLGTGLLTIEQCTFSGNQTVGIGNGGGAFLNGYNCAATLDNCTLSNNTAGYEGGGIMNFGSTTLTGCTLTNNSAVNGGAIANYGTMTVGDSSLSANTCSSSGGGIFSQETSDEYPATVNINSSTLSNNSASGGGAIYNESGTLTVTASTLSYNNATDGDGAGLYNYINSATLTNCTLYGNVSTSAGGAVFNSSNTASVTLTNCTLSANSIDSVYASAGSATLMNCILYGDTGGVEIYGATGSSVTATNCDVQGGISGDGVTDNGGNVSSDPLFATAGLANNGGLTDTVALQSGSPCLTVVPSGDEPATDQRFYTRPTPNGSIGAWDSGATPSAPTADSLFVGVLFNTATVVTLSGVDSNTPPQTLTYAVVAQPAHGTLSGEAPNLTYTPTDGSNGADSFTFTVENQTGLTSAPATVTLSVAVGVPTANSQTVAVPFDTATLVTVSGSDPNIPAESLTYGLGTPPGHGNISGTAPNWTYTPDTGFHGMDSFTFAVNNTSDLSSALATVTLNVAAGTPTANGQTVAVPHNMATAVTLTGSDPNVPTETLTFAIAANPTHGTLSGTAPNLTFTPTNGYYGPDSFTFTAENSSGLTSAPATVTLNVAAGTPTANGQTVAVPHNMATAVTLTGSDPNVPTETLTFAIAANPTHGTLSGTAPNLTFTPTNGYYGPDSFTFTAENSSGLTSAPATVTLNVAVGAPIADGATIPVAYDTPTTFALYGTEPNTPPLILTLAIATQPSHGTLSSAASGYTYTPAHGYSGTDSFTFTAEDSDGLISAPATVTLNVAAPVHAFAAGLCMISVPTDYSNQPLATVLGYASPRLAAWDLAVGSYVLTPDPPADALRVGQGYWVKFPMIEGIAALGTAPSAPFTVALAEGWNMIGCPQTSPLAVSAISVIDSSNVTHTFAEATGAGLVGNTLFTYQPGDTNYEDIPSASGSLTPYEGYWLHANQACTLSFP